MHSLLLLATLLALTGISFSSPHQKESDALLEDILSVAIQDEEGGDAQRADMEALNALANAYSSTEDEEEEGGDANARTEGYISKLGKIFKFLKKAGNVLHAHYGDNRYVKKYSKYLRCLPTFQEQLELVTAQSDDDDDDLLSSLEAQAESEEENANVQFLKKLWKKAKKFGKKALKVIRAVKQYLRCIKQSIEAQSEEEMKMVQQQAMNVLKKAITGRLVRI